MTRESAATLYGIPAERLCDVVALDPVNELHDPAERQRWATPDLFGSQPYAPLLDIDVLCLLTPGRTAASLPGACESARR